MSHNTLYQNLLDRLSESMEYFIDANGVDLTGRAVLQSPGDDLFDRIENTLSEEVRKGFCGLFSRKAARPTG